MQEILVFHEGQKRINSEAYKAENQINTADTLRKIAIGIKMKEREPEEVLSLTGLNTCCHR